MAQRWIRSLPVLVLALMVGQSYSNAQSVGAVGTALSLRLRDPHSPLLPIHEFSREAKATSLSQPGAVELGLAKQKIYNFTTADYPGADSSLAYDFNSDIVVGSFYTQNGENGLVFSKNSYHPFGFGSPYTGIYAINSSGQVVGDYYDGSKGLYFGYMYDGSTVTTIAPSGALSSDALDISDSGAIVGDYEDSSHTSHGFVYAGGVYTAIDYPGALDTEVWGINASGTIVGTYLDSAFKDHGFQLSHNHFVTINFSLAEQTLVQGINDKGAIAGSFEVNNATHGFTYINGVFSQVDVANALATVVVRIKNNGNIVGFYVDHNNNESHGIIGK